MIDLYYYIVICRYWACSWVLQIKSLDHQKKKIWQDTWFYSLGHPRSLFSTIHCVWWLATSYCFVFSVEWFLWLAISTEKVDSSAEELSGRSSPRKEIHLTTKATLKRPAQPDDPDASTSRITIDKVPRFEGVTTAQDSEGNFFSPNRFQCLADAVDLIDDDDMLSEPGIWLWLRICFCFTRRLSFSHCY